MKRLILVLITMVASALAQSTGGGQGAGGGGSGTVTSVSGTANQIDVATGTTTPVVSLDPSLILPTGTTATTPVVGNSSTSPATTAFVATAIKGNPFSAANTINLTAAPYYASGVSTAGTTTGVVTSGATTITLTSSTVAATYSANQGIYVVGAGTSSCQAVLDSNCYFGTVVSVTGAAITVTPATNHTTSGAATVYHDNTAAFVAAIAALLPAGSTGACASASCTGGIIFLPDSPNGAYLVNGPQVFCDLSGAQDTLTAIICLPDVDQSGTKVGSLATIEIDGISQASINFTAGAPIQGGALVSTLVNCNTCNLIAGKGLTTGGNTGFTNIRFASKNVDWRSYNSTTGDATAGPNIQLLNLVWVADAQLDNEIIDTGGAPTSLPAHTNGIGITGPGLNNYAQVVLHNVEVFGQYQAIVAAEHTYLDFVNFGYDVTGLVANSNLNSHPIYASYIDCESVVSCISPGANGAAIFVGEFDAEHDTGTFANICDICDASNLLVGTVNYNGNSPSAGGYAQPNITGNAQYSQNTHTIILSGVATPFGPYGMYWTYGSVIGATPQVGSPASAGTNYTLKINQAAQTLTLTPRNGLAITGGMITSTIANFTAQTISVRVGSTLPTGSTNVEDPTLHMGLNSNNYLAVDVYNGTLRLFDDVASSVTICGTWTYNPITDAYWQLAESSGTVTFLVSSDGVNWVVPANNLTGTGCGGSGAANKAATLFTYTSAVLIDLSLVNVGTPAPTYPGYVQFDCFTVNNTTTASCGGWQASASSVNGNTFPASAGFTSGGIPYYSSTSAMSSSTLLTANVLVKGGGAGNAPSSSSITDNGTTVSTSEALSAGAITGTSEVLNGKMTTYNSTATAGAGIPSILAVLDQTGVSTANSGSAQNILASTPAAGHYRVGIYVDQSAGCTTLGLGALTVKLGWTDATNARTPTTALTLSVSTVTTGTSDYVSAVQDLWSANASAITVTDTYTACSSGTFTYDQHAYVERIE
jgi:hypothetical protein